MTFHTAIKVSDPSQIGEARRTVARVGQEMRLSETQAGAAAIITTELATNLSRYAQSGQILVGATCDQRLEILAIDKGPGLDIQRCMQDGYSTGGTPGNGLGAVRRMAGEFDIYSSDQGTVVLARVAGPSQPSLFAKQRIECGAISIPAPGESVCGDAWYIELDEKQLRILVADGLGHGPAASEAAVAATRVFQRTGELGPKDFISEAHSALSGTRGAAVASGTLLLTGDKLRYAGIGNIGGSLVFSTESRGLMSHNGTVGALMRTVQELDYDWPRGGLLVMYSDGIQNRWDLRKYPGLNAHHPAVIASVLLRDFTRGRDDVTVVVLRRW